MKRIAAIHYSYYPQDTRPRREAEAMVEAGLSVDIICLRGAGELPDEDVRGVHVHRLPMQRRRAGKLNYILQYLDFLVRAFLRLSLLHVRDRFDLVHIHNMPDFLVFAAAVPKLTGSKVLLDLHDPMPELYMTKFKVAEESLMMAVLKRLEKASIAFAHTVITPNIAFRKLFISRGCPDEKIDIIMNSPMENVFRKAGSDAVQAAADRRHFVLMFHGGIYERHGLDTALQALSMLRDEIPNILLRVFGEGDYLEKFLEQVRKQGLERQVAYCGSVSLEEISQQIQLVDVGLIPNNKSPFTELNFPVRIFEYLCMDKPVIVPRTTGIMDYFDEESILFFEAGNAESLTATIRELYRNDALQRRVVEKGRSVYLSYKWELQKRRLVDIVSGLIGS